MNHLLGTLLLCTLIICLPVSAYSQDKPPAVGTDIKTVVKKPSGKSDSKVRKIMWDDLVPKGFEADTIIKKYEKEIKKLSEGQENPELLKKIMTEFNNAPSNEELDGVTVKIPGFVSPLDEEDGMVSDFLLVPYFGSCIHSPPPPVNQTVLVAPEKGKSIPLDDIYKPVWVTGKVTVKRQETELAEAGYVIKNAELEIYEDDPDKP